MDKNMNASVIAERETKNLLTSLTQVIGTENAELLKSVLILCFQMGMSHQQDKELARLGIEINNPERSDEGEPTPEELQEKADEVREQI